MITVSKLPIIGSMHDRQKFQETLLPNGITLYTYQTPSPVTCFELLVPVGAGHAYAENGLLPGSPHFLEHLQLIRSRHYPDAYALDRAIGLLGGHSNGVTYPTTTHYELDVPSAELEWASEALVDRVFSPQFTESEVSNERSVIHNEREQRKFYPGRSRVGQYYHTQFLNDVEYSLEQLFGTDADLKATTVSVLEEMHQRITSSPLTKVVAVGPSNFQLLADQLAKIPTTPHTFSTNIAEARWANRSFRREYFDTVTQPTLEVAWIHPRLPFAEYRAASFIISLLVNSTHGILYRELREEKGWTYGIDGYCTQRERNTLFNFSFPLNTPEQAEYVHSVLQERIQTAITNQDLVEDEIRRCRGSQVYHYQTPSDITDGASFDLTTYGHIHSEADWLMATEALRDPAFRSEIANRYFQVSDAGAMLFMPERRQLVPRRLAEAATKAA